METSRAIEAFDALAHDTRLRVFRLLVQAGPDGVTAGDIAAEVAVPASTLSHHLGLLERAALVTARRRGRTVIYAADYAGTRALIGFLMEDCCQGRPEICGTLPAAVCTEEFA